MNAYKPGYTLIEAMMVVILMAIIAAFAVPQISVSVRNNAVSDATNEVVTAFRAARTMAAQSGMAHRVHLVASAGSQIVRVDRGEDNLCTFDVPPSACNDAPGALWGGGGCGRRVVRFDSDLFVAAEVRLVPGGMSINDDNLIGL